MTIKSFINLIKEEAGTLALILAVLLAITAIITFSQPLRYEANNKLLIQQDISKFDPYNVFKVNEYYNNLIKEIVHSESFFKQVLDSGYNINADYFGDNRKEQIKTWNKTVDIISTDIGTIEIKIYHTDTKEAKQILLAITDILVNKNSQYQNLDNNIDIKIINQITTSNYPTKPNIILNFIYTIIIATLISLLYLYYKSEKEYHSIDKDDNSNYNNKMEKNNIDTEKKMKPKALTDNSETENHENNIKTENYYNRDFNDEKYTEEDYKDDNKEYEDNNSLNNNEKENDENNNEKQEKSIKEGEEINLEKEIEEEADINNLFNK
ncbi:hypothetical protein K9M50_02190 [Patescibacteria group bacterium]|nr:hypothetical protein [Patescibacteria group bacterium]